MIDLVVGFKAKIFGLGFEAQGLGFVIHLLGFGFAVPGLVPCGFVNPLPHGDANRHTIFKRKNLLVTFKIIS